MTLADRLGLGLGDGRGRQVTGEVVVACLVGVAVVAGVALVAGIRDAVGAVVVVVVAGTVGVVFRRRWTAQWTSVADRVVGDRPVLGVFGGPPAIEVVVEGRPVRVEQVSTLDQAPAGGTATVDASDVTTTVFATPIESSFQGEFEIVGHRQPGRDREHRDEELDGGFDAVLDPGTEVEKYAVRAADDAVAEAVLTPAVEEALEDVEVVGVLTVNGYGREVSHALEGSVYDPDRVERHATAVARAAAAAETAQVERGGDRDRGPNHESEAL